MSQLPCKKRRIDLGDFTAPTDLRAAKVSDSDSESSESDDMWAPIGTTVGYQPCGLPPMAPPSPPPNNCSTRQISRDLLAQVQANDPKLQALCVIGINFQKLTERGCRFRFPYLLVDSLGPNGLEKIIDAISANTKLKWLDCFTNRNFTGLLFDILAQNTGIEIVRWNFSLDAGDYRRLASALQTNTTLRAVESPDDGKLSFFELEARFLLQKNLELPVLYHRLSLIEKFGQSALAREAVRRCKSRMFAYFLPKNFTRRNNARHKTPTIPLTLDNVQAVSFQPRSLQIMIDSAEQVEVTEHFQDVEHTLEPACNSDEAFARTVERNVRARTDGSVASDWPDIELNFELVVREGLNEHDDTNSSWTLYSSTVAKGPKCFLPGTTFVKEDGFPVIVDALQSKERVQGPEGPGEVDECIPLGENTRDVTRFSISIGSEPPVSHKVTADHIMKLHDKGRTLARDMRAGDRLISSFPGDPSYGTVIDVETCLERTSVFRVTFVNDLPVYFGTQDSDMQNMVAAYGDPAELEEFRFKGKICTPPIQCPAVVQ